MTSASTSPSRRRPVGALASTEHRPFADDAESAEAARVDARSVPLGSRERSRPPRGRRPSRAGTMMAPAGLGTDLPMRVAVGAGLARRVRDPVRLRPALRDGPRRRRPRRGGLRVLRHAPPEGLPPGQPRRRGRRRRVADRHLQPGDHRHTARAVPRRRVGRCGTSTCGGLETQPLPSSAATLSGSSMSACWFARRLAPQPAGQDQGKAIFLFAVVLTVACDAGAYFGGSIAGRRHSSTGSAPTRRSRVWWSAGSPPCSPG